MSCYLKGDNCLVNLEMVPIFLIDKEVGADANYDLMIVLQGGAKCPLLKGSFKECEELLQQIKAILVERADMEAQAATAMIQTFKAIQRRAREGDEWKEEDPPDA